MAKEIDYSKIHVVIGVPTTGNPPWQFASSLRTLVVPCTSSLVWTVRTMIDSARNMIVMNAMDIPEATHILMIDDDEVFPPDMLIKLLEHDEDVVGGLAFKRNNDFQPCVFKRKGENFYPMLPNYYQEVDAIGTGAVLFKKEVFQKIPYPWFETYYEKGAPEKHWSVDFDFCKKAAANGVKIFCDPSFEIGHVALPQIVGRNEFMHYIETHKDAPWVAENNTSVENAKQTK